MEIDSPHDPEDGAPETVPGAGTVTEMKDWTRLSPRAGFSADRVTDLLHGLEGITDVERLRARVGLRRDRLEAAGARVPAELVAQLLDHAAELSGDRLVGLHLGERLRPRSVLTYVTRTQATLGDAFKLFCRYQHLSLPGPSFVLVARGSSTLFIALPALQSGASRHLTEFLFARVVAEGGRNVAPGLVVQGVHFRHPPAASQTEYERILGQPVRFAQSEDALLIPTTALDQRMRGANSVVAAAAMHPARTQADISGDLSFRERVAMVVRSLLLAAEPSDRAAAAESLGLTRELLQRRLWSERTTFRSVRSAVQRQIALELSAVPGLTPAEVAVRAGFRSADELAAALHRWLVQPPSDGGDE